ncbi:DUF2793 domain-containing protein [Methylobacterium platani]|uniref:DUF2793 domain-containing protein n=1 Tax=Methylobacterium platani TaxID=427683 RepID=UPI000B2A8E76|nr:DUF2793 domain-containing protein [Methylobacterium platani]
MPDAATANLALPLLQAAQAQKHVTHNEALVALDTLVQLAVLDKDALAPPASPAEGDRYLIAGAAPTGAWAGWAGRVVRYQDGAWRSFVPRPGWLAFVADEADLYTYTGVAWASFRSTLTALQNLARLGIGTTADAANPFAAKLNKALWTALTTAEGGTGDLRYTLNKQAPGNTLSLLMQSGFSGRAEIGLTGDDDLRLKVSADGSTWREALRVDRATGGLDLAAAEASVPIAATVDLGALPALRVVLTGSGTVSSFGTGPNRVRFLRFTGAATLAHNAVSLVLPGGAALVTAAGDTALAVSDAAGNWRVVDYARASGKPVAGPAAAEILDASASGLAVLTGSPASGATALGLGSAAVPVFGGVTVGSPPLGTAAGTRSPAVTLVSANVGNTDQLGIFHYRKQAGSDHTSTEQVIQRRVDSVDMGFLSFGSSNVWLGSGTTKVFGIGGSEAVLNGSLNVNGDQRTERITKLSTAGSLRWKFGADSNPEGGGNNGSNFVFYRYGDDGSFLGNAFYIVRATGAATFEKEIFVNANVTITNAGDAKLYVEDTGADATSYRRKMLYSSRTVGGGSDTLIRAQRPSDAATLDYVFAAAFPGTVLTSGHLAGGLPGPMRLASYTVATVPAGSAGMLVYVSNGRKPAEGAGGGTGVVACYSNGNWRRLSDDSPVAA